MFAPACTWASSFLNAAVTWVVGSFPFSSQPTLRAHPWPGHTEASLKMSPLLDMRNSRHVHFRSCHNPLPIQACVNAQKARQPVGHLGRESIESIAPMRHGRLGKGTEESWQ